jgi:hypothetical protein
MAVVADAFCGDCRRLTASDGNFLKRDRMSGNLDSVSTAWVKKCFETRGGYKGEAVGPFAVRFKASYGDLARSAEEGCPCCLFFIETIRESREVGPTGHDLLLVRHTEGVGLDSIYCGGPERDRTSGRRSRQGDYVCLYKETVPLARYNLCTKGEMMPYIMLRRP